MAVSFDTPKSGSDYAVPVSGTVAAHATIQVKIQLKVTNTGASGPRTDYYYRVVEVGNSTFTAKQVSGTYTIAIVPKLYGSDTVTETVTWDYKG